MKKSTNVTVTIRKATPHPNPERLIKPWVDIILREILAQEAQQSS